MMERKCLGRFATDETDAMFYSSPRKEGGNWRERGGNAENNTRDDVFRGWRRHTRHAMRQ